ncbi:MAG: saccharopine dehydrogenase NADP-binding domain-containing protein [Micropepsaceae bacterium]
MTKYEIENLGEHGMADSTSSLRILLVGGYGVVGTQVAELLRAHHPSATLLIAGRRISEATAVASRLGNAEPVQIDTQAADPLAGIGGRIDAVAQLVHDHDDAVLRATIRRSAAYIDITRGAAPQTRAYAAAALESPHAPVMFASNWMAGVPAIVAMHLASRLAQVETVAISILFYGADKGGPDSEGAGDTLATSFMSRVNGAWQKTPPMSDPVSIRFPSGLERPVYRLAMADGVTLAQATSARDVAVRLGLDSAATTKTTHFMVRTGLWSMLQSERMTWLRKRLTHNPSKEGAPHEIVVEVTGRGSDGKDRTLRAGLLDSKGQSHLTALGVVANLERALGLHGEKLRPGVAVPETAPNGARLLQLLRAARVTVELTPPEI